MAIYKEGADNNLFPSAEQRSTYNAETKLRAQPWWDPEDTGYSKYIKWVRKFFGGQNFSGDKIIDLKVDILAVLSAREDLLSVWCFSIFF